jgi:UbiA prenyltransferase family
MAIKPYLQLVRLPNLFTAAADSLAGWLLVGGAFHDLRHWPWLVLASVATYAGGVALNDVFDVEIDRRERPGRPIPSGRVGRSTAAVLAVSLLGLGLLFAWLAATRHGLAVELALVGCILAYDTGLKRTVLGPEVMGACRGLNLLLGMSHAASLGGPVCWAVAAAYAIFVTGITWISRSEVDPAGELNPGVVAGVFLQNFAFLVYLAACVHPEYFPGYGTRMASDPYAAIYGPMFLLIWVIWINRHTIPAIRTSESREVQHAVGVCIRSLVLPHIGLLLAVNVSIGLFALLGLSLAATTSGRWVYST